VVTPARGCSRDRNEEQDSGLRRSSVERNKEGSSAESVSVELSEPARLRLDRRFLPPTFTITSPRYIEGEVMKAGGKVTVRAES
jgi:hypothetical protein